MDKNQTKNGFLLFEVMAALIVFSMSCLLIAWNQWYLVQQEQEAIMRFQALNFARNVIENMRNENCFSPSKQIDDKFTITTQQKPILSKIIASSLEKNFQLVEVMVTWQSTMAKRSVKLITGLMCNEKK
ncbi:MAG: hypothetical protein WCD44_03000 [Candidatus Babeliales bacterium]